MERFYTTTAIDYVNGAPHIGHAYEKILTDVIYRHFTQRCEDTYFLTGTDEHGIKIQKTSAAQGMSPKELCDMNAQKFQDAWKALGVNYDQFIRTTDTQHEKIVQKIFDKLLKQGDIYKHSYTGLYCQGCEAFLSEKDLTEDGLCPDHLKKPEEVSEENYFFKLTKYKDAIIKHIKTNPDFIVPSFRANEVINQLENIEDISVSRAKSNVNWGIPVLGDNDQVIYVWIDALSNYITALGYNPDGENDEKFNKYWPADVHTDNGGRCDGGRRGYLGALGDPNAFCGGGVTVGVKSLTYRLNEGFDSGQDLPRILGLCQLIPRKRMLCFEQRGSFNAHIFHGDPRLLSGGCFLFRLSKTCFISRA